MKIQEKPDYLIFADSAKNGECTNFPDVSRGWGVTIDQTGAKPPLEWMNGAFNRIDKNMLYLLQQGVPEWCETVIYPVNAIIKYNGVLYTATVKNDNAIPTTSNKWKKTNPEIADASETNKGIVKLNSAVDSVSEKEAATPKAVKSAYDTAITANNNAISANSNANNAHKNIETLGGRISTIEDKFQPSGVESRVYSADKRVYMLIRNDGVFGVYSTVKKGFAWQVNHDGWMDGYITADRVGGLDKFVRDRTLPVGIPQPWPTNKPPAGWFECNGSTFDKNQFPRLAAAYPSGRLPDLRSEFIRGWDSGRGVDSGRAILSHQDCALQSHNHSTPISVFSEQGADNPWGSGGSKHEGEYIFNTHYTGGNETRPRNVSFMYIVKAE